jgi:hypothetical protein
MIALGEAALWTSVAAFHDQTLRLTKRRDLENLKAAAAKTKVADQHS